MDIRKFGITIAVAILTAIFIYATADAFAPQVDYNRCYENSPYGPKAVAERSGTCTDALADETARQSCIDQGASYEAVYDSNGCVREYICNTCYKENEAKDQQRKQVIFYVSILLGLIFIVAGFLLPLGTIHEWVGLGFIFGGVIGLFIGTVAYWSNLERWLRPLVIAAELGVVLFIVYKRMAGEKSAEQPVIANAKAKRTKR